MRFRLLSWLAAGVLFMAGCSSFGGSKKDDAGSLYAIENSNIQMPSKKDKDKDGKSAKTASGKRIPNRDETADDGKNGKGKKGKKGETTEEDEERSKREEADFLYREALDSIQARNYIRAEMSLRKAVELDPEDPRFWCDLGRVQYWQEKYPDAHRAYRKTESLLKELEPKDRFERQQLDNILATVYTNMGDLFREWSRPADALAAYEEALRRNPGMIRLSYEIGNQHLKLGDYAKAEDCFRQVLQRVKNPSEQLALKAHVGLAILYHLTDRNKQAYEQVIFVERQQYRVAPDLRASIVRSLERERATDQYGSIWQ